MVKKRLLRKLASNEEIKDILEKLYNQYNPKDYPHMWIKPKDQSNDMWIIFQATLFGLQEKNINVDKETVLDELNKFIEEKKQIKNEIISVSPKIQPILNNYNDTLRIDFDPADPYERDGPVVVMREFTRNGYKDHAFIGEKGETHTIVQDKHPDIKKHCINKEGIPVICHANYWHPIVFITGYNKYDNIKEVAKIIKKKYPSIEKVYSFNGNSRGGIIHKEAKKHLPKRIV